MDNFGQKPFQLKNFLSSTEKLFNFNCITLKNLLKNFTYNAENGKQNHNKPFRLLLKVNLLSTCTFLVNKSKVKSFKK